MKITASAAAILLILCTTTGCVTNSEYDRYGMPKDAHVGKRYEYGNRVPPMDPNRVVSLQVCRYDYVFDSHNLRCVN